MPGTPPRTPHDRLLRLALVASCALGACRTPEPEPPGPTDPQVREDPNLGMPVYTGSVLEDLPDPQLGLSGQDPRRPR